MKNTMKKILCAVLVVVMLVTTLPFIGLDYQVKAVEYKNGDTIQYGSYPKSKVTNSNLITQLNNIDKYWESYGRYSKDGTYVEWYKYCDFFYEDAKYRAINLINYYSGYESENGYRKDTIYYFQYLPLSWKVIDASSGLIICNEIIDCRAYQDTVINIDEEYWQDSSKSVYASDYSKSFIRKWLNTEFSNVAFTAEQKNNIKTTEINNEDSKYVLNSTSDKMFLISYDDANTKLDSSSRDRYGTDYSKCLGLHRMPGNLYGWGVGQSWWWLRTPYNSNETMTVYDDGAGGGSPIRSYYVDNTSIGIVPACCLDELKNDSTIKGVTYFPKSYNFEEDSYNFENYTTIFGLSEKYFTTIYEESSGELLHKVKKNVSNDGLCFGMAYTTAAIYNGLPSVNSIFNENIFAADQYRNTIREIEKTDKLYINDMKISIDDYIKYAFIYQWAQETVRENFDVNGFIDGAIENDMLGIVICLYRNDDTGHAVLLVGYEEKSDGSLILYVDDPNNINNLETIEVESDGTWEFSNPWNGTVDSENTDRCAYVDVYKPLQILSSGNKATVKEGIDLNGNSTTETFIENMDRVNADKVLLYVESDSFTIACEDMYEVGGVDYTGSANDTEEQGKLYWINNDKTISISDLTDDNNEIALAGDNTIITADLTKNSEVTMTIDENDINAKVETESGNEFTLSFETVIADEEYNNIKTEITVTGTATMDDITATQTETGLVVTGIEDGTITLSKNDEAISTQIITDADSDIEITYDKNGNNDKLDVEYESNSSAEPEIKNCSCNCHKGGISGFFFKIILFFQKIFKSNKTCACGVAHY